MGNLFLPKTPPILLALLFPFCPSCVWSCLVSKHASGLVSPYVAGCVIGDSSPQVEAYYWASPVGPPILTNQL